MDEGYLVARYVYEERPDGRYVTIVSTQLSGYQGQTEKPNLGISNSLDGLASTGSAETAIAARESCRPSSQWPWSIFTKLDLGSRVRLAVVG
jgi:hypothetical protein